MTRVRGRLLAIAIGLGIAVAGCDSVGPRDSSAPPIGGGLGGTFLLAAALLSLAGGLIVCLSIARQARAHRRTAARLQRAARTVLVEGEPVGIVPGAGVAVVAGLRRPAIYMSQDVIAGLDRDEICAVIRHERHHERCHAPARLVVLAGIDSVIGSLPLAARRIEQARARIEITADACALDAGSSRQTIARAILKLQLTSPVSTAAEFASATDLRLQALLAEPAPRPNASIAGLLLVAGSIAALALGVCSAGIH